MVNNSGEKNTTLVGKERTLAENSMYQKRCPTGKAVLNKQTSPLVKTKWTCVKIHVNT